MNNIDRLYQLLEQLRTDENEAEIEEIKEYIEQGDSKTALEKLEELTLQNEEKYHIEEEIDNIQEKPKKQIIETQQLYPKQLTAPELENTYIGLLLDNPKSISMYYFLYEDCFFENEELLNIYKSILFTEGQAYAPEIAKRDFNFPKDTQEAYQLKVELKRKVEEKHYNFEKIYVELKKIFILRKHYLNMPMKDIQDKIVEIVNYKLYDEMSAEEVENAIKQVTVTNKFKQAILSENVTQFLLKRDNNLTNGLALPFPILSSVFKGIRKGETMAFSMPSNAGKSRITVDLASYIAFVHHKKVLIVSNEMSEEKMKLCLITTILNHPEIQQQHGQIIQKTEGELLEFKFRPDNKKEVKVDKDGFIIKEEKESQKDFVKRLQKVSSEFNKTITATEWLNKQMRDRIYFIQLTDHTNDELRKVMMNYYYKEKVEYIFYDTLKTDTENIGNSEELKKTATILSNIAQNFNVFIASTLQLAETTTLPINLNINDLAVNRSVKEVLDTLCLMKQINQDTFQNYEYSLKEVDTKFYPLKKYDDPDVRYYACVVDKNRAGAKPRLLFRINLAYNSWEELGYLRLKQNKTEQ